MSCNLRVVVGRVEEEEVEEERRRRSLSPAVTGEEEEDLGGGVYLESYTRKARFLTRWDQHAVAQRRP
jgi:hypothetical protein